MCQLKPNTCLFVHDNKRNSYTQTIPQFCVRLPLTNTLRILLQYNSDGIQGSRWSALQLKIMFDVTETSVAHQGRIKEL